MDIRKLDFVSGSFDVAIDKGTMDAMMTSKGDVWVGIVPIHRKVSATLTILCFRILRTRWYKIAMLKLTKYCGKHRLSENLQFFLTTPCL